MTRSRRSLALLAALAGLSLLSCGREITGPGDGLGFGRNRIAALALEPQFPVIPGVNAISDVVPFSSVRITLRRADGVTAKDTTIQFPSGVDSVSLAIDVPLPVTAPDSGLTFGLSLAYVNAAGDTVFRGGPLPVTARPSGSSGAQPVAIPVQWVPPPGPPPVSVDITPASGSAVAGTTTTFTAVARDAQGTAMPNIPAFFRSADTSRALVPNPASGLTTWRAVRGPARVIATLPNLIADTAVFDVSLPAVGLMPVSGINQTATVGTALPAPVVFRVIASDSVPVAGVRVDFFANTGGGSVSVLADTSDASGLVSVNWTLGATVGQQQLRALLTTNNFNQFVLATGTAPLPTQVVFSNVATTATAGATITPVTVEVRDGAGAVSAGFTGPVTISLDPAGSGATLAGTTTVNAVAGVASFTDLSIQRAAAGMSLIATSGTLAADTSGLTVTPSAPATLALVSGGGQSAPISTTLGAPFVARVTDAFTNPVASVTVTWAITQGGGSLSAPTSVTDAAGNASVTYTSGTATGTSIVTGTVAGLAGSPVSFSTTVGAGAATALVFTQAPTGTLVAGAPAGNVTVEARDAGGNLATSFVGTVWFRINTGPGAGLDSLSAVAIGGIATLSGESFDEVGVYTLRANAAGLTDAISGSFTVVAGPAFQISPDTASGSGQTGIAGQALPLPLRAVVTDSLGNAVAGVAVTVTTLRGVDTLGTFNGTTDANGLLSYTPILPATTGSVTFRFTSAGLSGSGFILSANVIAGAATQLAIVQQPGNTSSNANIPVMIVQARDAAGNHVTSFTGNIEVVVDSGPVLGWSMGGTQVVAASGGTAAFGDITLDRAGQYRLRFRSAGLDSVVTDPFVVSAGTAAQLTVVEGDAQSAPAAATLPTPLGARLADAFGNPIAGATVTWGVTSGGGSFTPTTSITDADGVARSSWTLGGTAGGQGAEASFAALTAAFTATATSTDANIVWTGAVNANWSEPGNWSTGTVPTASDSVRLTTAGNFPSLDAPAFVSRLRIEPAVTLQLDTFPLFVGGTLDVDATATVLSDSIGAFVLIGGSGAVRGPVHRLMVQAGTHPLNGPTSTDDFLMISGGTLAVGGQALTVGGMLTTAGAGVLSMTGTGQVTVQGDAIFSGGSTAGLLTGGQLTVRGDFVQGGGSPQAFSADAGHTTVLDGPAAQSITFLDPDVALTGSCATSCFGTLISNRAAGTGTLTASSDFKAIATIAISGEHFDATGRTIISAGAPSFTSDIVAAHRIGWQTGLTRTAGTFTVDSLIAWGAGTLLASETVPTRVVGQYEVTGPHPAGIVVDGPGATLAVVGVAAVGSGGTALVTRGNGRVLMQEASDTLGVNGSADFGGATIDGLMTAGVLAINGDLAVSNELDDAFVASGTHRTRFIGPNATIHFTRIGGNRFQDLDLHPVGAATFDGNAEISGNVTIGPATSVVGGNVIFIGGNLIDSLGTRWQASQTHFTGSDPVIPHQFLGSVIFENGVVLDTALSVGGRLETRNQALNLNGHRVDVTGDFEARDNGVLVMTNAADTLAIVGNATFRGGSTAGLLTDGYLEVHGNFTQTGNAAAFAASGAHRTWLRGSAIQSVSFATPGTGGGTSHFAALGVGQTTLGIYVFLTSDVHVDGMLLTEPALTRRFVAVSPFRITSRGATVDDLTFDGVTWRLIDGAPVTSVANVAFVSIDPAAIAFDVERSSGTISLTNPTWTVTPTTGAYVRVTDPDGATGGAFDLAVSGATPAGHGGRVIVVAPATLSGWTTGVFEWNGNVSSDWFDPANWSVNQVPAATDSVVIPSAGVTNLPALVTSVTVRTLTNQNPLPISLDGGAILTAVQRLDLRGDVDGVVCTDGAVALGTGAPAAAMQGLLNCPVTAGATTTTLEGPTRVNGVANSLTVASGAQLIVGGQKLHVEGTLATTGTGTLVMVNASDSVDVVDASFGGGSTNGLLTLGELRIRNGLTATTTDAFSATGAHRTRFVPGVGDTAALNAVAPVAFGSLDVARNLRLSGDATVSLITRIEQGAALVGPGHLRAQGDFHGEVGTLVAPAAVELYGVLADTGTFRPDTTIFAGAGQVMPFRVGPVATPAYQLVRITGDVTMGVTGFPDSIGTDLVIDGGQFRVTDGATMAFLRVGRDLRVINGGLLRSQNLNHQFFVYRHAVFDGADATGALQQGNFRMRGDFTQLATTSALSFVPEPGFFVSLDSVGTVSFATPAQSRFAQLTLTPSPSANPDRTLLSDVNVTGTFYVTATGGGTIRSSVLGAGGTRLLSFGGSSVNEDLAIHNVALRQVGAEAMEFAGQLTFADFDPDAVQFEVARDSGFVELVSPVFSTVPSVTGRYLRVTDTNAGDGANLTVNVSGTPNPGVHAGFAEAVAPAVLTGWGFAPDFTWTGGATTSDWTNVANWSGGLIPAASDSVFIPGALLYNPVIPDGTTLRALVSARTEGPITTAGSLTITGRLAVPVTGGLSCGTSLAFTNAVTPMSARGTVNCFTRILSGTLAAADTLRITANDLQVEGSSILDVGNTHVRVDGFFSTITSGVLRMTQDSAHLEVTQGASFGGGSTAGQLTNGLLQVGGNFTQNNDAESFAASGAHVTEFNGAVNQTVTFANPGLAVGSSHFANLAIGQPAGITNVVLANDVYAIGQLRGGSGPQRMISSPDNRLLATAGANYSGAVFGNVRWVLYGGAPITQVDGISFSGMDPAAVQFTVEQQGGTVTVANLSFDTTPTTGAYLRALDVDGPANGFFELAVVTPSPAGHGGFIQTQDGATITGWDEFGPFIWTGAEDTNWNETNNWLNGVVPTASDSVTISASALFGPDINAPTTLRALVNQSPTLAVTLQSQPLTITERLVTGYANVGIGCSDSPLLTIAPTTTATIAGHVACDMLIAGTGATSLSDSLLLGRSLRISSGLPFDAEGRVIRIVDSLVTDNTGTLRMDDAGTLIDVRRDASFRGGATTGQLSAGRLRVGGDFTQEVSANSFDAFGITIELHDAFAGAEGTPTASFSNPLTSRFGFLALGEGARAFQSEVFVQHDLIFGTNANVTGTSRLTVLGAVVDTMTYSTPPTLQLPYLAVDQTLGYRGTFAIDTMYFGGTVTERPIPASINGVRVPYGVLIVGGPRVVQSATAIDTLVTSGTLLVNSTGTLRAAETGATAVTHIGDTLVVVPGGTLLLSEAGATVIAQNGARFQGTATAADGVLRLGGDVNIGPGAFTAINLHTTELFDGHVDHDNYTLTVADTASHFGTLRPESGIWLVAGTQADTVLVNTALNFTGPATLDGDAVVRVFGPVQGQPSATLSLTHLAYFNNWQFTGTYQVDTLTLFGTGGQPLYARDELANLIPYGVVRITGDARPIVAPTEQLQLGGRMIIDGGNFRVGTAANGTDSVRVRVNGLTTTNGGILTMTHAEGELEVDGSAVFGGGSTNGTLTTGLLLLRAGFVQTGDPEAFHATGTHRTQFSTEGQQTVSFANPGPGAGASSFRTMHIQQAPGSRISLESNAFATLSLRETMASQAAVRADAPRILTVGGTNLSDVAFNGVTLAVVNGGDVEAMDALAFDSLPSNVNQLEFHRDGGAVALNAPNFLVLPQAGAHYLVANDLNGADADPLTINVTAPSPLAHGGRVAINGTAALNGWGATADLTWTGAVNSDWGDPGNWDANAVPDFSASAIIPSSGTPPLLTGDRTVGSLDVQTGGTLTIGSASALTTRGAVAVAGSVLISTPNDASSELRLAPVGTGAFAAPGQIDARVIVLGGTVALSDSVRVTGDQSMGITVAGGVLDLNGHRINLTGAFRTTGGALRMQNAADTLIVDHVLNFDGASTEGELTAGTIIAHQDLIQYASLSPTAFASTGTHKVVFMGSSFDSQLYFDSPGGTASRVANIAFDKSPGRVVNFASSSAHIGNLLLNESPVNVFGGTVTVTGSVAAPGASATWDLAADGFVQLTGVNPSTCDGLTFVVTTTPANFTPVVCHDPPALENSWTGGGDGTSWTDAANWSLGRAPLAGDSVVVNGTPSISLSGSATVGWLMMGLSGTPSLTLNNGASLTVDSAAVTLPGTTVTMVTGSTLGGDGVMSFNGQFNWNGGTMSGSGGTLFAGPASIGAGGTAQLVDRTLAVSGTTTMAGAMVGVNAPVLNVNGGGVLLFNANTSYFSGVNGVDSIRIVNGGTIRRSTATGTARIDWPIINSGTIEVLTGTLELHNALEHVLGSVTVASGAVLSSLGNVVAHPTATIDVGDGAALQLRAGGVSVAPGAHDLQAGSSLTGLGRVEIIAGNTTVSGDVDIDSLLITNGNVSINTASDTVRINGGSLNGGGTFDGTATIAIAGQFNIAGNGANGVGTLYIRPSGLLTVTGAGVRGWDITVDGAWVWTQNNISLLNHTVTTAKFPQVSIRTGGVLDIQHAAAAFTLSGTGTTITNNGTILKSAGSVTSTITVSDVLNFTGIVVNAGVLTITNGCTQSGPVGGGGTLNGLGCIN